MIARTAHAKINLALHVTGQRDDGNHLLDTLVVFAEHGDRLILEEPHHAHGPIAVSIDGPFGEGLTGGAGNLVTHAAMLMREAVKRAGTEPRPVLIHLEKNLPIASGIGGGSADAAATLLALQEFWQSDVDLSQLASLLGADVAMCLHSKALRARGIGDQIIPLTLTRPMHLALVNPMVEVSTPAVFKTLEQRDGSPISEYEISTFPDVDELADMRNDLQVPAIALQSLIREVLEQLTESSPLLARMSGSGATCFAIYDSLEEAEAAAKLVLTNNPDWWAVATSTTASI